MKIDHSQAQAIRHRDGPAMVLAGPGSGKTTVITHRVEHMISSYHIDPSSILVITFSRAAAGLMQERFLHLVKRQRYPVTFGTFHAIFFHILKYSYGFDSRQVVSNETQTRFLREYIHRLRLDETDELDLLRSLLQEISLVKMAETDESAYHPLSCKEDTFWMIFRAYEEFLDQNRYLDFDDILVRTKELLKQRPDILSGWQDIYRYILVDEFQDINPVQYEVVRMLALPQNNLFIVGDDDQSIYRFRGASPGIMLHFEKDYPDAVRICLDTNYRSTPEIVETSKNLISYNKNRFDKNIRAVSAGGPSPIFRSFQSQREQNACLIETIIQLNRRTGIPLHEIAVLFRTNDQPALLMRMMSEHQIPFVSKQNIPNLFDHWIAGDLNAYLRLAQGERSRRLFLAIMNRPNRSLSRESLPFEEVSFDAWSDFYLGRQDLLAQLKKLEGDLDALSRMSPYSAINYIRKAAGYEEYVKKFALSRNISQNKLFSVLDEIQEESRQFQSFHEWFAYQEEVRKLAAKNKAEKNTVESAVLFSTLHAAKGLEFDTVFLIDINENVIPDKKALTPDDLEEERRLFYVGLTRAKRRLYLFCSAQIRNKTMLPSRFLNECERKADLR